MDIAPGAIIGGKYRIERPLARGGMGSVWVARHAQLGSTVAIKFLDASFAAAAAHRARFEREARAAANLKSPHVVQVHDYGFEGSAPYIVMELLEGEDLNQRLHRVRRMSVHDTARVLAQVGKALRKAHDAGFAHRDLKPANLFIARIDDEEVVKILDFGIAKEQHAAAGDATRTGEVIGSPHYMSPEQVRAEKDLDHRTDLWSLGVILYRMLVGVLPFPGDQLGPVLAKILTDPVPPPSQQAPDLPRAMDGFFARALARDKQQRFQSIQEMVEAFQAAAGGKEAFPSISMSLGTGPVAGGAPAATAVWGGPTPGPGAGPMHGSGPITGAGPMHGSGPITGAGPMHGSGPVQPGTGPVTAGGLSATGQPVKSKGGVVVVLAVVAMAAGAAAIAGFFLLRGAPSDAVAAQGTAATQASSQATASGAASAATAPTAGSSASAATPEPTASSTEAPAASAASASKPTAGGTAKPKGTPTAKPKEKWF